MGQTKSKNKDMLSKIIKTDINDVNFNSSNREDVNGYNFMISLKNNTDDKSFKEVLNKKYFIVIKYFIRICIFIDYLNKNKTSKLFEFKEDFVFLKHKLEIFVRNVNKNTNKNLNSSDQIKKNVTDVIEKYLNIFKRDASKHINEYSEKINNLNLNEYNSVELNILNIPIEMYSSL